MSCKNDHDQIRNEQYHIEVPDCVAVELLQSIGVMHTEKMLTCEHWAVKQTINRGQRPLI